MTEVATLPLSCERLEVLDESTIAVSRRQSIYFCSLHSSTPAAISVEVSLTKKAECFAPWHPPGAALQKCGVFYAEKSNIHFIRCGTDKEALRNVLESPLPAAERIEEMRVFFGTTLVVRTVDNIYCYALDPAIAIDMTPQLPLIGSVSLQHPAANGDTTEVVLMEGSPVNNVGGDVDNSLAVVMYSSNTRRVSGLLIAVGTARLTVLVSTKDGGIPLPSNMNGSLISWSLDWYRREMLFVFTDTDKGSTAVLTTTLALSTMEWAASSTDLTSLPSVPSDVTYTHTGDIWAMDKSCDGIVKLFKLSSGCVAQEVVLQRTAGRGVISMTSLGSKLYVLMGSTVLELLGSEGEHGTPSNPTLCDWLMQQIAKKPQEVTQSKTSTEDKAGNEMKNEIETILAFVKNPESSSLPDMIVRDCRYVSCALDSAGENRHAILDAIQTTKGKNDSHSALLRYIAVAQSIHPFTILRALNALDPSVRLSLSVLLATKPSLMSGGVRLLEWSSPVRSYCHTMGQTQSKLFTAALCETALTALSAGALGAVELLCAVADFVMVTTLGNDKRTAVPREEAAAEVSIAEAVGVLSSYAQWALAAAPALGTMSAHIGPVRNGKKEAAVRDGIAHSIVLSRSVQIEPMSLLMRRQQS